MVISRDIATQEVNAWLDFQGITEDQKKNGVVINRSERMIHAVMDGALIIDSESKVITQKLKFPFGAEAKITELKFKPHITVGDINNAKSGLNFDDDTNAGLAYISASTGEPASILLKMNSKDYKISDTIILFFML